MGKHSKNSSKTKSVSTRPVKKSKPYHTRILSKNKQQVESFALFGGSLYDSKFDEVLYKDFVFEASLLPANTKRFIK